MSKNSWKVLGSGGGSIWNGREKGEGNPDLGLSGGFSCAHHVFGVSERPRITPEERRWLSEMLLVGLLFLLTGLAVLSLLIP
ncbi:hypothetical protein AKJ57_02665 [candidate division MSBL1 archaeon SCGC-AAA259A05]|uniref:Uncharacterized protein n=1 Tax=candidate division MSBL1 archaeon SCGC-AAA259A05 TaxID=1698259 RepID=A0A133UA43_9EURY|nr:hypothetical protein AKJ57_02665 [candidate division MSBL1 archaeon SCGC-AAA259A05]